MDAEPHHRYVLPGPSIWPFLTRALITIGLIGSVFQFSWYYVACRSGVHRPDRLVLAAQARGGANHDSAAHARRLAPAASYDISERAPLWWGQLLLAFIEGTMFCILIAMYFYIRLSMDMWPPPGMQLPRRVSPTSRSSR